MSGRINIQNSADNELTQKIEAFNNGAMVLAVRLDLAYEIYQRCDAIAAGSSQIDLLKLKDKVADFMKNVLDEDDMKNVIDRMQDRIKKRKLDKEYIPGKEPQQLTKLADPYLANSPAAFRWQMLADTALSAQRKQTLVVREEMRESDEDDDVPMLSPVARDRFRVILKDGSFMRRGEDNSFVNFDTIGEISGSREGYCSYDINRKGEISVFSDRDEDPYQLYHKDELFLHHSSLSAGGPVFSAGEMKIDQGKLAVLGVRSGHFKPQLEHVYETLKYLQRHDVDIANTKVYIYRQQFIAESLGTPKAIELDQHSPHDYHYAYQATELFSYLEQVVNSRQALLKQLNVLTRSDDKLFSNKPKNISAEKLVALAKLKIKIEKTKLIDFRLGKFDADLAGIVKGEIRLVEVKADRSQKRS